MQSLVQPSRSRPAAGQRRGQEAQTCARVMLRAQCTWRTAASLQGQPMASRRDVALTSGLLFLLAGSGWAAQPAAAGTQRCVANVGSPWLCSRWYGSELPSEPRPRHATQLREA